MLLQCGAMLAKKLLVHVDDKITACASSNLLFSYELLIGPQPNSLKCIVTFL